MEVHGSPQGFTQLLLSMGVPGLDWPGLDREDAIQKEDECSSPSWSVESGRSGSSGGFHGVLGAVPSVNSSDLPPSAHTWEKSVPIFMISGAAEKMIAFTNAVPEWLCKPRQEKLFSWEALFGHVELLKEDKLSMFPHLYSKALLAGKINPLLAVLKPKLVLFPKEMKSRCPLKEDAPWSLLYYSKGTTIEVPNTREEFEVRLAANVALGLQPRQLDGTIAVARLRAKLHLSNGQYMMVAPKDRPDGQSKQQLLH